MFCCMKAEISAVGRPHAQEHQPPMKLFKGLEIQQEFLRKGSDSSRTEKNSPLDEHPVLMLNCCGFLSFLSNRVRSSCFHCPSVLGKSLSAILSDAGNRQNENCVYLFFLYTPSYSGTAFTWKNKSHLFVNSKLRILKAPKNEKILHTEKTVFIIVNTLFVIFKIT